MTIFFRAVGLINFVSHSREGNTINYLLATGDTHCRKGSLTKYLPKLEEPSFIWLALGLCSRVAGFETGVTGMVYERAASSLSIQETGATVMNRGDPHEEDFLLLLLQVQYSGP